MASFACYLAVVGADGDGGPRVLHRRPLADREDTPFPAAIAAFALSSLPARPTRRRTMTTFLADLDHFSFQTL